MTAQPKPTAAGVLREHGIRRESVSMTEHPQWFGCWGCAWKGDSSGHSGHQADVLAAAGLLATAEHDAQVRADAITEVWDQAHRAIADAIAERDELRRRTDRVLELADSLERDPGEVGPLILVAEDIRRVAT